MNKKPIILLLILISTLILNATDQKIMFIDGSNIYVKIFLFHFPIGKQYDTYFTVENDELTLTITILRDSIINEPINEQEKIKLFDTDVSFTIRNIPKNVTGYYTLPLVVRANRKITRRSVQFSIISKENIMVIKGFSDITLGELNDNEEYVKRGSWKYPFHFDLRLQL